MGSVEVSPGETAGPGLGWSRGLVARSVTDQKIRRFLELETLL